MLVGLEFGINNKVIGKVDYSKVIKIEGTRANVNLPGDFTPKAFDDNLIGFDFSQHNVKSLGCESTAPQIVEEWARIQNEGVPLGKAAEAFVIAQIVESLRGLYLVSPGWASLVELVDLICSLRAAEGNTLIGFKSRYGMARRNLKGITRKLDSNKVGWDRYFRYVHDLAVAVDSWVSEFMVFREMLRLGHTVKLMKEGFDMEIDGTHATEVKLRWEPITRELFKKQDEADEKVPSEGWPVTPESILAMFCWTAYPDLKRAFERQQADILFVDITRTFSFFLMAAAAMFMKPQWDVATALDQALVASKQGEQTVIIVGRAQSETSRLYACPLQRESVEGIAALMRNAARGTALEHDSLALAKVWGQLTSQRRPTQPDIR